LWPGGEVLLEQILGSDEAELAASSPVALASAIKAPVFLAHGGADRRAPKEHAERLKDAFDDAGVRYEWFYVRSAGHGFALPENREKLYTGLFEFFSANL
jgi:dipeptidyl aminopeptidase/acylaminoacyl peptidase